MPKIPISFVLPVYNESGNILTVFNLLQKYVPSQFAPTYLFVDDGSTDTTLDILKKLAQKNTTVKYLSFTRNFGHQHALKAGLDQARGKAVISLDSDGQHPPEVIPQMLKLWQQGYKIVYTRRTPNANGGVLKNLTSAWFYRVINSLSETKIEGGAADFRLLDQDVVTFIRNNPESTLFLRGLVAWSGYKNVGIDYQPRERSWGETKYTYTKMMRLAIDAITSFSIVPLRFATVIGLIMSLFSGLYALYAAWVWITHRSSVIIGWPSVIISVLFIGGLQLLILGIVGEYIGKIFVEAKKRPLYIVKESNL